ncbi:MAG TPA: autotransporter-associated beta strand repeat-containing protein, partial [Rhodanobacteraceae bacterium]
MNRCRKRALTLAVAVALALWAAEVLAAAPPHAIPDSHLDNALVPPWGRLNSRAPVAAAPIGGQGARFATSRTWAKGVTLCTLTAVAATPPPATTELCLDNGWAPPRDLLNASPLVWASAPVGDSTWSAISPIWTSAVVLSAPAASAEALSPAEPDLRPDNPPVPPPVLLNIWAPVSASAPGGSGTWSTTSLTWTDAEGDGPVAMWPQPSFAHFQGNPGTVTVDDSVGDVGVTGMEFAVDGYTLTGAALKLMPDSDNVATIYVDYDASSGAVYKAIINSTLAGTANVSLMGPGTLVLTGNNTYSGWTSIAYGTLQLGNGGTSGSIVGNVMDSTSLVFDRSDAVTYGGVISRSGNVTQAGAGTLTLTGVNT